MNAPGLVDRIRAALSTHSPVREQRMFGGLSFMLNDKMEIGTWKDGGILVRVDPARRPELIERPGASTPEMGAGRPMGPGWIRVAEEYADADLDFWITEALDFNPRARASK